MRPAKPDVAVQPDMFRETLEAILDPRHELLELARRIDWTKLDAACGETFVEQVGRPGLPTRLMAGLHILKHVKGLSDEAVCAAWVENVNGAETIAAMMAAFRRLDPRMRGSVTFDNDTCFARHMLLRGMLSATTYFCDAYASWQKGNYVFVDRLNQGGGEQGASHVGCTPVRRPLRAVASLKSGNSHYRPTE